MIITKFKYLHFIIYYESMKAVIVKSLMLFIIIALVFSMFLELPVLSAKPVIAHDNGKRPEEIVVTITKDGRITHVIYVAPASDPVVLNNNDDSNNDSIVTGDPF